MSSPSSDTSNSIAAPSLAAPVPAVAAPADSAVASLGSHSIKASEALFLQQKQEQGALDAPSPSHSPIDPEQLRERIAQEDDLAYSPPPLTVQEDEDDADELNKTSGPENAGLEEHVLSHIHIDDAKPREKEVQPEQPVAPIVPGKQVALVWRNLTVSVPDKSSAEPRTLLNDSTLLNTLACRLDVRTKVQGDMRLNGQPYHNAELKKISGYVMQDDLLNPNLTARETLHYAAALRLPRSFSAAEREARVDEVIREMGLQRCQNVIVGDPSKKGISGGERRRVCIGMELLTRPSLLFLDEPTSGLDAVTALSLMQLLQRITRSGRCTVVCSIHQPQARLFALFDRLILLKSGRILFQGSIPAALQLFEDCGFPVPHYSNPADHLLDVITPAMDSSLSQALATESAAAVKSVETSPPPISSPLVDRNDDDDEDELSAASAPQDDVGNSSKLFATFKAPDVDLGFGSATPLLMERDQISWWKQFTVLIRRNLHDAERRKKSILGNIIQSILIGILFGFAFFQIGDGQYSVTRRNPACFFFCVNQGVVGGLAIINSFPSERLLMLRERAAGTYYTSAYFLAKILVDTLVTLPVPIVFGIISYWVIGLQAHAGKFFLFLLFVILCNLASTSLALMISAICRTTDFATVVLPMSIEICRLFGGFYLSPANLPKYFSWLDALSYIKYSYVGIALNEFSHLELKCDQKTGACTPDGRTSINTLGLDYISTGGCVGVLFGYVIFCQIVAYIAVRYNKTV